MASGASTNGTSSQSDLPCTQQPTNCSSTRVASWMGTRVAHLDKSKLRPPATLFRCQETCRTVKPSRGTMPFCAMNRCHPPNNGAENRNFDYPSLPSSLFQGLLPEDRMLDTLLPLLASR